jgi:putrescine transport system substrate-binding protein
MKKIVGLAMLAVLAVAQPVAAEEKTLNVYNWSDYIAPDTVARFTEATGIKVNYDVYDSNEILETKLLASSLVSRISFES